MIGLIGSYDKCEECDTHDTRGDDDIDRYTKYPECEIAMERSIKYKYESADHYDETRPLRMSSDIWVCEWSTTFCQEHDRSEE